MAEQPAIAMRGVGRTFRQARTSWREPGPAVPAVRDVDLTVAAGERVGIVGESGSGKSTLLRMMCALDHPTHGTVQVQGRSIVGQSWRRLQWVRGEIGVVFQDPMSSLDPRMRVGETVAEPLVAQRIGTRSSRADRVREMLAAVGLPDDAARRYPHQFSGGQRQRISIARALAPSPSILVADEPVSALDVSVRAQVLNLVTEVVRTRGLTLVFVSHDLSVVRQVCDRVAVMRHGELVEVAATDRLFEAPQHEYTQELLAAIPTLH